MPTPYPDKDFKDYYQILGVQKSANDKDIKHAFRKGALLYHPDKNAHDQAAAEAKFKELTEAYEVLSDPRKRRVFDQTEQLSSMKQAFAHSSSSSPSPSSSSTTHPPKGGRFSPPNPEVFAQFFGGKPGVARPEPRKARTSQMPAVEYKLELPLEDLYLGANKRMKISRQRPDSADGPSVQDHKIVEIQVKPGWKKGTKITFFGEGDQRPGMLPGDVVFVIGEKPHPRFTREGDNLIYTHQCTLKEALLSAPVTVLTLDKRSLSVELSQDNITPGFVKVVSGEGMPKKSDPNKRGDLLIKFDIQFPKLSSQQKEAIAELLR